MTGATDGIGLALAKEIAKKGVNVVLVSRSLDKLRAAEKEVKEKAPSVQTKTIAFDFSKGSPGDYASWPAQTVNYTESHDDRTWIDAITEYPDNNGSDPSVSDQRRTRMMGAIMMMSIGIPMIHAGQDFLFSKNGVNNTYQRGDLNALDYERRIEYALTSDYFKDWISFRKSELGELVRHYSRASEGFFQFIKTEGRNALAAVFNADRSKGNARLLFAVNPEREPLRILLGNWEADWIQLADHDRFWGFEEKSLNNNLRFELTLPPLGTGLWVSCS